MMKVFIGGSRSIRKLDANIEEKLANIIQKRYLVLIGDADGADSLVQEYFQINNYPNVIVYCSGNKCRNNIGSWSEKHILISSALTKREFYIAKDKQMAKDTDYGFMVWDGRSRGTLANIQFLAQQHKPTLVYFELVKQFRIIRHPNEIGCLIDPLWKF